MPPKLENIVKITLKKPKFPEFQVGKSEFSLDIKTLILISPNLAKLSYGLSPLQLHKKIDKIDPKKKTPKNLIKTNLMGVMEGWPGYWGRDSSCHGYCEQYINERRDHPKLR